MFIIFSFELGSKGRMVHLLKEKSKIGLAEKPRKKFKAYSPAAIKSKSIEYKAIGTGESHLDAHSQK